MTVICSIAGAAGGAVGSVAGAVASIAQQTYDDPNFDGRSFAAGGLFLTGRGNSVDQDFERRFRHIDYKLQRQQLHREDIRDLVDLTASRMNVYNLVSTLLLAFCISWFTDNVLVDSKMPCWYADLFLISNFSAVGYLVLSVWLSMYASVASKGIGVRLLTSYERLSLPDQATIDTISVPYYFPTTGVVSFWKRVLGLAPPLQGALSKWGTRAPNSSAASDTPVASSDGGVAVGVAGGVAVGSSAAGSGNKPVPSTDHLQHFRRYLLELPRWLGHDLYSRLCMSLGMIMMLQTLSYSVLASMWRTTPLGAAICALGVKLLALILLKLDFNLHLTGRYRQMLAVFFFYLLPSFLGSLIFWMPILETQSLEKFLSLEPHFGRISFVVFLLHAAWTGYVARFLSGGIDTSGHFIPFQFANVLEWVDRVAPLQVSQMASAASALQEAMQQIMAEEATSQVISVRRRQNEAMQDLGLRLVDASSNLANSRMNDPFRVKIKQAEYVLNYFAAWAEAADVFAVLTALRNPEVQGRLKPEQVRAIDSDYKGFLKTCHQLELGIVCKERGSATWDMATEEACIVRLNASMTAEGPPRFLWVDTGSHEVFVEKPPESRGGLITSFEHLARSVIPHWVSLTKDVVPFSELPPLVPQETVMDADEASVDPLAQDGGVAPGIWTSSARADAISPVVDLPHKAVLAFTIGVMVWWVCAGLLHMLRWYPDDHALRLYPDSGPNNTGTNDIDIKSYVLPAEDHTQNDSQFSFLNPPGKPSLFSVEALHCADDRVVFSGKYAAFVGFLRASGHIDSYAYEELPHGAVDATLCDSNGKCDALRLNAKGGQWVLDPLNSGRLQKSVIPIPRTWRLVAGAWADCPTHGSLCVAGSLVGWDGSALIVASLLRRTHVSGGSDAHGGNWTVKPRYDMDPFIGFCDGEAKCAQEVNGSETHAKYDDVRAIQMRRAGRVVTVLLGSGSMHTWDLVKGRVLARWHTGKQFTSMCHTSQWLFLSRHVRGAGSTIISRALPAAFVKHLSAG